MRVKRAVSDLLREAVIGAALGLVLLGIGGRVAMRMVALAIAQPPLLNAGGTFTVVAAGAAAGVGGVLLHALSGTVVRGRRGVWVRPLRITIFAALLAFVTSRGLRGSPGPTWPFWLLVAVYGSALEVLVARRLSGAIGEPAESGEGTAQGVGRL